MTEDRTAGYGSTLSIEPGGAEPIPPTERRGHPSQLLWTWSSPNLEFATIFVGALGVLYFGLGLWQAVLAIVLGNGLAAVAHGALSAWGPRSGLSQMMFSRRAFGYLGNILPAGLNAVLLGVGWFAVNSASGALALSELTGLTTTAALILVAAATCVLAVLGHNIIQLFERYAFPVLAVCFSIDVVIVLFAADWTGSGNPVPGAFWIAMAASFGYTAAWTPMAADYSRYFRPEDARRAGLFAATGLFLTTTIMQVAGAAAVTAVGVGLWNSGNPTASYAGLLPGWLGVLTLVAITLGSTSANTLNLYSSALSFAALGVEFSTRFLRAILAVVIAVIGTSIAVIGLANIATYQNFLLVTSYWIGPWLGVMFANLLLCRHTADAGRVTARGYRNPSGVVAMLVAGLLSIWLLSNQSFYVGPIPQRWPEVGDMTFVAGFGIAFVLTAVLHRLWGHRDAVG